MAYINTGSIEFQGRIDTYGFHGTTYSYHELSSVSGSQPVVYTNKLLQVMLTDVCIYRADLIEQELIAQEELVQNRNNAQRRLNDALGEILRLEKNQEDILKACGVLSSSTCNIINNDVMPYLNSDSQKALKDLMAKNTGDGMSAGDMQKVEQYVQSTYELQSNDMQEDSVRLQQVMQKRDSAYELASDLAKKQRDSVKDTLNTITQ